MRASMGSAEGGEGGRCDIEPCEGSVTLTASHQKGGGGAFTAEPGGTHLKDVWQQVKEDGLTAAVLFTQGLEESVDVQAAELGPVRVRVCVGELLYCPTIIQPYIVRTLWPEASPALLVSAHGGDVVAVIAGC